MFNRDEAYNILEEIIDCVDVDVTKKLTNFLLARQKFIDILRNVFNKSNLNCDIKDSYIGEIDMAQIKADENIYIAIECVVRESGDEDWHGDTVCIPVQILTQENPDENLYNQIKLLSREVEQEGHEPRILN